MFIFQIIVRFEKFLIKILEDICDLISFGDISHLKSNSLLVLFVAKFQEWARQFIGMVVIVHNFKEIIIIGFFFTSFFPDDVAWGLFSLQFSRQIFSLPRWSWNQAEPETKTGHAHPTRWVEPRTAGYGGRLRLQTGRATTERLGVEECVGVVVESRFKYS